ncbi:MAG: FecR domain-containing protein [Nitrosomonadales bacterium]|nr:FecR domain-containing protein [Nitrosomonadales bacterium]
MFPQQHFKLKLSHQAILLAMVSAAYPVTGYCIVAGRADFVIGEVVAVAPDGIQRPLAKGAVINAGDAINTAAGARAQIRFSDGGYVSLQPGSQFRVDEYQYENKTDGKEKGFFSLLKGGLRAITGAIGRTNRDTYRVATQAATIGIRGTGYNAVQEGEGLLVNVGEGAISLTNNAGTLVVTSGEAAYVADFNTAPEFTFQKPSTPPAGFLKPLDEYFSEAEQRDATGGLAILPVALISGPGYVLANAYRYDSCEDGCIDLWSYTADVTATFSSTSQLIQYDGAEGGALGTASVSFSATDGIIGWGRWNGGITDENYPYPHPMHLTNGDTGDTFHYVVGLPTPQADIDAMSNITATYSLLGGTLPTGDGFEGGVGTLNGGSLTAYFGSRTVDVGLQIAFPAAGSYDITATGMDINSGSTFSGSGTATGSGYCSEGCYANVAGFFAGANASRAGVAYSFDDPYSSGNVAGVAAFTKSAAGPDGIDPNMY